MFAVQGVEFSGCCCLITMIVSVIELSGNRESSVELIKLDVSRTFPQLCIFQQVSVGCISETCRVVVMLLLVLLVLFAIASVLLSDAAVFT